MKEVVLLIVKFNGGNKVKSIVNRVLACLVITVLLQQPAIAEAPMLRGSELLMKSGLNAQLEFLPTNIKSGLAQALAKGLPLPGDKQRILENAIDQAYAADTLKSMLGKRVEPLFSIDEQKILLDFLDSPLGKRIVKAETAMADEKVMQTLMEKRSQLVNEVTKNTVRLGLIQSLNDAMNGTKRGVDMAIYTGIALDLAMIGLMPNAAKPPLEEVVKMHQDNRFALTPVIAQFVLAGSMQAYESFTDAELNQYLDFALSPVGKKYFDSIGNELDHVLMECGANLTKIAAQLSSKPL